MVVTDKENQRRHRAHHRHLPAHQDAPQAHQRQEVSSTGDVREQAGEPAAYVLFGEEGPRMKRRSSEAADKQARIPGLIKVEFTSFFSSPGADVERKFEALGGSEEGSGDRAVLVKTKRDRHVPAGNKQHPVYFADEGKIKVEDTTSLGPREEGHVQPSGHDVSGSKGRQHRTRRKRLAAQECTAPLEDPSPVCPPNVSSKTGVMVLLEAAEHTNIRAVRTQEDPYCNKRTAMPPSLKPLHVFTSAHNHHTHDGHEHGGDNSTCCWSPCSLAGADMKGLSSLSSSSGFSTDTEAESPGSVASSAGSSVIDSTLVIDEGNQADEEEDDDDDDDEGPKLGKTLLVPERRTRIANMMPKGLEATPFPADCYSSYSSSIEFHSNGIPHQIPSKKVEFLVSKSGTEGTVSSNGTRSGSPAPAWTHRPLEDLSLAHAILDLSSPHRIPKDKRFNPDSTTYCSDDDLLHFRMVASDRVDAHLHSMETDLEPGRLELDCPSDNNPDGTATAADATTNPANGAGLMVYTYEEFFMSDGRSKKRAVESSTKPTTTTTATNAGPSPGPGPAATSSGKYRCSECGKYYATSSNLSRHKQTHRSLESGATRQCPTCGKAYVSMPALAMHVLTHQLAHKCPICNKGFSRPWLLQGHLRSHTGERPYGCAHCGKAFADRSNLRAHMQMHSNVKSFHCHRCNKAFALKAYLNKHMESACVGHGGKPGSLDGDGAFSTAGSRSTSPQSSPEDPPPLSDEEKDITSHLDPILVAPVN